MIKKTINEVPAEPVNIDGAKDVKVRVLFGPKDSAPNFAMRVFELAPAGHTPWHKHNFEHEAIALDGQMTITTAQGDTAFAAGDATLIKPDEMHQFKNTSNTCPARFICLVPIEYQK